MELKDFVGKHMLSGVDMGREGDANYIVFRLDERAYMAIEDPEDGYRSHMNAIYEYENYKFKNTFEPQEVLCSYDDGGNNGRNDIIDFRDMKNGKVVLSVGTENTDDWYPSFVASWIPENLEINKPKYENDVDRAIDLIANYLASRYSCPILPVFISENATEKEKWVAELRTIVMESEF